LEKVKWFCFQDNEFLLLFDSIQFLPEAEFFYFEQVLLLSFCL